jgi:hypothetical protein
MAPPLPDDPLKPSRPLKPSCPLLPLGVPVPPEPRRPPRPPFPPDPPGPPSDFRCRAAKPEEAGETRVGSGIDRPTPVLPGRRRQTEPRTSLSGSTGLAVHKFAPSGGVIFSRRFRRVLAVASWRQRCSRVPCHPCPLRATSSCPCPVGIEPSGQPAAARGVFRPWDESGK